MSDVAINTLLEEAVKNAREDRDVTHGLLADLLIKLKGPGDIGFRELGAIAAKYVETLQRSNEQIMKVGSMAYKKNADLDLTDDEKDQIFDKLQSANKIEEDE